MTPSSHRARQQRALQAVRLGLEGVGYTSEHLFSNYSYGDWFDEARSRRVATLAAFAYSPPSYDNACVAVLVPNGVAGRDLVSQHRSLGAPLAFELGDSGISVWRVGHDGNSTRLEIAELQVEDVAATFAERAGQWSADSILRAKNAVPGRRAGQRDFVDMGLIPALEGQIREKLDALLHDVIVKTKSAYQKETGGKANDQQLFRLVFRILTAKILRDREAEGFSELTVADGAAAILSAVSNFYGDSEAVLGSAVAQDMALRTLWSGLDFRNLSFDTLAHVYEHTLVSTESRRKYGTHSTPVAVARYLVERLPLDDSPQEERIILEPCSGHCIFLTLLMKRLRGILPLAMTAEERHAYFVANLRGFEADLFAKEVGGLCMMLADYPNSNGWQLFNEDVFDSARFNDQLTTARFVISNPPFEQFAAAEKLRYGKLRATTKPAELILRVLDLAKKAIAIAFVLPRQFIDAKRYAAARLALARRFSKIEVVALPDKIFSNSKTESSLVIATGPVPEPGSVFVHYGEVSESGRAGFLASHKVSRFDVRRRTVADIGVSLLIPELFNVWEAVKGCATLDSTAEIFSHGVQWKSFRNDTCYSDVPKSHFRKGYTRVQRSMMAFEPPPPAFINLDPALLRQGADLPWDRPKVVTNTARVSRGRWRVSAFADFNGFAFTQRFIGLWPKDDGVPPLALAAFLNGPLANAFMVTHERARDNSVKVLKRIPLPAFGGSEWEVLAALAERYLAAVATPAPASKSIRLALLHQMDAHTLSGYGLASHLERRILDFFAGQRRAVMGEFDYDIQTFAEYRALGVMENQPRDGIGTMKKRRGKLAQSLMLGKLSSEESEELTEIDAILTRYSGIIKPLPFDAVERMELEARLNGLDPDEVILGHGDSRLPVPGNAARS